MLVNFNHEFHIPECNPLLQLFHLMSDFACNNMLPVTLNCFWRGLTSIVLHTLHILFTRKRKHTEFSISSLNWGNGGEADIYNNGQLFLIVSLAFYFGKQYSRYLKKLLKY